MPNLSFGNLFQTHPSTDFQFSSIAFSIIILMFIGSFVVDIIQKKNIGRAAINKALKKLPFHMWMVAGIALVMTWTRIEGIPYISMRIWWIALLIYVVFVGYKFSKQITLYDKNKKKYSRIQKEKEKKLKYLPKKKRK